MAVQLQQPGGATCAAEGKPQPVIRPVEPADGPALHGLLTACLLDVLADRDRWLARWRWQCWDNPFRQGRPAGWVIVDGDNIVGHLGAVYLPLLIGDTRVTGVIGTDYAVSADAAARGGSFVALELAQTLFATCSDCLVMATTANEKTAAVFGRFGCRPVGWTREFWRAPATLAQQVRSCWGGRSRVIRRVLDSPVGSRLVEAVRRVPAIPIPGRCWLDAVGPDSRDDRGLLWQQVAALSRTAAGTPGRPDVVLAGDRSPTYLDWRYGRHPEREALRVLTVRGSEDGLVGVAIVFGERRPDRHIVYVEDILVHPRWPDVVQVLLCAALRWASDCGADYLITSPGRRSVRHLLWELGFENRARNAPAVVVQSSPGTHHAARALPDPLDDQIEFWHGIMF
ncbi:MAG: hypothetical protein HY718_14190 [Planctomycetes bacterium]|nr:hypothetical protein [Planctomycetota bacterium]